LVVREVEEIEVRGPSVGLEGAVKKFKKARKDVFVKKGFWFSKEKVSVESVLKEVKKVEKDMGGEIKIV